MWGKSTDPELANLSLGWNTQTLAMTIMMVGGCAKDPVYESEHSTALREVM